jgi:hypothetical protein
MKKKFQIEITLTTSKIGAFIILLICTIYSFLTKDAEVLIVGMGLCAGLLGLKSWNQTRERIRNVSENDSGS